nr:deleted in malignant brain tumors 1 protein-like [Lytechinus pictus]
MLGFASATTHYCCAKFGEGSSERKLKVYCEGDEANITDCSHYFATEPVDPVYSSDSRYYCDHNEDVGLECDPGTAWNNPHDIRLVGGATPFEGRVEIYYEDAWTTVCDERIRNEEANVLCRMLGHIGASSFHCCGKFGRGAAENMIRDVRCEGNEENITDCTFDHGVEQPGYSSSDYRGTYCDHSDDLGLVCIPADIRIHDGSKRPGHQKGRVELAQNLQWKAFCAESMDLNLAIVLCRMLGEHTAKSFYDIELLDHEEGAVLNVTYSCQGTEDNVADCEQQNRTTLNCSRDRWVSGITCVSLPVRLVSRKDDEGRVEVYHGISWSAISYSSWNSRAADVVCRMLGYAGASAAYRDGELYEAPSVNVLLERVICNGTERNIAHCNMSEFRRLTYSPDGYAAARCEGAMDVPIRLKGGEDTNSGRVEIFHYGSWGTICATGDLIRTTGNEHYAMNIANVLCRMLGFPRALSYECCGQYGHGTGGIYLDTLKCSGKEANILECPKSDQGLHRRCNHFMDLGVICQPNVDYQIRLLGGPSPLEGRVEVKSHASSIWGTVCDDNWDLTDSNVVCRMLGYERAESYSRGLYEKTSKRRPIILDEVECDGTETNIGHCRVHHRHDCSHDEDVEVKCVDWTTSASSTPSNTKKITDTGENLARNSEVTSSAMPPWTVPTRRTFALIIAQALYIVVALIVIVLLTIRMQHYRRRARASNITEIPLTGDSK